MAAMRRSRRGFLLAALGALVTQGLAVVTGVTGSSGTRLEIRALLEDRDQWNMYLLGLSALQNASQSDQSGYYQISGTSVCLLPGAIHATRQC